MCVCGDQRMRDGETWRRGDGEMDLPAFVHLIPGPQWWWRDHLQRRGWGLADVHRHCKRFDRQQHRHTVRRPPPPSLFPLIFVYPVAAQDAFPGACAFPGRLSLCFAVAICVRPPDTRFVGIVPVLTWECTSTPLHFECFLSLCLWACAMS